MIIKIKTHAIIREIIGKDIINLEVPENISCEELIKELAKSFPNAKSILNVTKIACNNEYVNNDNRIIKGETYSLIPPVSGG